MFTTKLIIWDIVNDQIDQLVFPKHYNLIDKVSVFYIHLTFFKYRKLIIVFNYYSMSLFTFYTTFKIQ